VCPPERTREKPPLGYVEFVEQRYRLRATGDIVRGLASRPNRIIPQNQCTRMGQSWTLHALMGKRENQETIAQSDTRRSHEGNGEAESGWGCKTVGLSPFVRIEALVGRTMLSSEL
jgi:hypothetical protein